MDLVRDCTYSSTIHQYNLPNLLQRLAYDKDGVPKVKMGGKEDIMKALCARRGPTCSALQTEGEVKRVVSVMIKIYLKMVDYYYSKHPDVKRDPTKVCLFLIWYALHTRRPS